MNAKSQPIIRIGFLLSTLALGGGCAFQEQYDGEETIAEVQQAFAGANDKELNGPGSNGGGNNGDWSNGGGNNGGGNNGGGNNGGGNNGGGNNGGGNNGGGNNGGGNNGGGNNGGGNNGGGNNGGGNNGNSMSPWDEITHHAFDLKTISSVKLNGVESSDAAAKAEFIQLLTDHSTDNGNNHGQGANQGQGAGNDGAPQLVGSEATGKTTDGSEITIRFESAHPFTSVTGDELARYTVSFTRAGQGGKAYVCGKDNGGPIEAIPITGKWDFGQGVPGGGSKESDPTLVTFACRGFALYKCIDYGYPPWLTKSGVDLEEHHQACVRMIRADYCGDGRPWTVDGTLINLYDNLGVQLDTFDWPVEAEWAPEGARCLSHQRIQNLPEHPDCHFELRADECGNPPHWGATLLVSEAE